MVEKQAKPSNQPKKFYITTPIYYVNDIPHIGHAYTTIIADSLTRHKKLAGYEVYFLTGTDEHGQKIEKSAAEKGLSPLELADKVVGRFKQLWKELLINYDFFIRTTEPFHEKGVQEIFQRLKEKGDIYKGIYKGWYCVSCENFLAEDIPQDEDGLKTCPDCGQKANQVAEDCYFFRLSAYRDKLLTFYQQNPNFVRPPARMNEVVSFVRQGLKDLSITRTTVRWGIPVPGDPEHTIYVWFDALHNYLTGIGYGWNKELFAKFWPADIHLIGKDILRFHAIFWPAFLMAVGFPLPHCVFSHGWWLKDETKMSKTKGNVLDPSLILEDFGPDPLRYFLLREVPIGLDGNFSHEGFLHRVNSDLANDLGNLVHRTLTMINNYFQGKLNEVGDETSLDQNLQAAFEKAKSQVIAHYDDLAINRALEEIWVFVNQVNKYLAENEPWKIARRPEKRPRLARILYQAGCALRGIALLIYPVMPASATKIWEMLGEKTKLTDRYYDQFRFDGWERGLRISPPKPLFPRVKLEDFIKGKKAQQPPPKKTPKEEKMEMISFDEFMKIDLRVGEILTVEKVEGTKKLYKIQVSLGEETRQMVSGIAEEYKPEDLTGKKVVVVANLKPAVIRGIESQTMLLAADVNGQAVIPFFIEDVPAGAKVR
ncbi:MAG: methionine--tRNA ligase [Candidatus Aminicenantes bacterium]|nr:MAG: methionine--tRNA ligase [Candidatus Aminicenantes bacterium]